MSCLRTHCFLVVPVATVRDTFRCHFWIRSGFDKKGVIPMEPERPAIPPSPKPVGVIEQRPQEHYKASSPPVALRSASSRDVQEASQSGLQQKHPKRRRGGIWKQNSTLLIMTILACFSFLFLLICRCSASSLLSRTIGPLKALWGAPGWVSRIFSIFSRLMMPGVLSSIPFS